MGARTEFGIRRLDRVTFFAQSSDDSIEIIPMEPRGRLQCRAMGSGVALRDDMGSDLLTDLL